MSSRWFTDHTNSIRKWENKESCPTREATIILTAKSDKNRKENISYSHV